MSTMTSGPLFYPRPSADGRGFVPPVGAQTGTVVAREARGKVALFKLANGTVIEARRFVPIGRGDTVIHDDDSLAVFVKRDREWIDVKAAWSKSVRLHLSGVELDLTFKEVETETELRLFQQLKQFHYRGGGGAGRIVPMIGTVEAADLPRVIGFVELTSSMIVNTARKRFFDGMYWEADGLGWNTWDRSTSQALSSLICRISRFVIHPELRGLGLAKHFARAAMSLARARWHYGGHRPRFLEITADMLRYYPFVGEGFAYIGETEGNEHRVSKDMNYLVRRALSPDGVKGMPQGGGGIMSLQRGYATTLLDYIDQTGSSLEEAVARLQYDPAALDQQSWEKLHRLNRRPKPCYIAGLTKDAADYVQAQTIRSSIKVTPPHRNNVRPAPVAWRLTDVLVEVRADILQSKNARLLQDAFGFVGASLCSTVIPKLDVTVTPGEITLICGASGAGKSLLLEAARQLLKGKGKPLERLAGSGLKISGVADRAASITSLPTLDPQVAPLDLLGNAPLSKLLAIAGRCGLAEPQLLVRPIATLSSGQRYRLQLAMALLEEPEVVFIDNFCEALDRFSMRAVCRGFETLVKEFNVAAVVATASYERISECFSADQVIMLRRGDDPVTRKRKASGLQKAFDEQPFYLEGTG